jgi:hypothetical protein
MFAKPIAWNFNLDLLELFLSISSDYKSSTMKVDNAVRTCNAGFFKCIYRHKGSLALNQTQLTTAASYGCFNILQWVLITGRTFKPSKDFLSRIMVDGHAKCLAL